MAGNPSCSTTIPCRPVDPVPYQYTYIYEDNGEGDIPGAQTTDGPGSLRDFIGEEGMGVWLLTMADTVAGHTGLVENLTIRLDPQIVGTGASLDVLTNAFFFDFIDVPIGATNLTVCLYNDSDHALARGALRPPRQSSHPNQLRPNAGRQSPLGMLVCKPHTLHPRSTPAAITSASSIRMASPRPFALDATVDLDPNSIVPVIYTAAGPTPILDDAVSLSTIPVTNASPVLSLDVGVRIDHPRVSDLVLTLVSPSGTRVLLDENRGGASPNGMGLNIILTNIVLDHFHRRSPRLDECHQHPLHLRQPVHCL